MSRPRDDIPLSYINDNLGDEPDEADEAFMAVTTITPLNPIVSNANEHYQGSMLLEPGAFQVYMNAGFSGATNTLTLTVKTTGGTTLTTLVCTAAPATVGPSALFDVSSGTQYVDFFTTITANGYSAWVKSISILKV